MTVQTARKAAGYTQQRLAEKLGVSRSAVAMWETGGTRPRSDRLLRLAEILGCTADELLGREPPREAS